MSGDTIFYVSVKKKFRPTWALVWMVIVLWTFFNSHKCCKVNNMLNFWEWHYTLPSRLFSVV